MTIYLSLIFKKNDVMSSNAYPADLQVYKQLSQMRGMDVYRRDDIPDNYHYKNGRYVQEILVCAKPGMNVDTCAHVCGCLKKLQCFRHHIYRIHYQRC